MTGPSTKQSKARLVISKNERVFICGKTRSGKSYLIKKVIAPGLKRAVIIDYKHEVEVPGYRRIVRPEDVIKVKKCVYTPIGSIEEQNTQVSCIEELAFKFGNITLIYDDLSDREKQMGSVPSLQNNIRMGASRGVGVIVAHQRPSALKLSFMSEAEHFFIFFLNLQEDKDRMKKIIGDENSPLIDKISYENHEFVYYTPRERNAVIGRIS